MTKKGKNGVVVVEKSRMNVSKHGVEILKMAEQTSLSQTPFCFLWQCPSLSARSQTGSTRTTYTTTSKHVASCEVQAWHHAGHKGNDAIMSHCPFSIAAMGTWVNLKL